MYHQNRISKQQKFPVKKKKTNRVKNEIEFLQKSLENNAKAFVEGPRVKKWTQLDLRSIKPLTPAQEDLFKSFFEGSHICAYGSAGTGKSYITMWLALNEIFRENPKHNRIIIIRSCVASRDIGFLPGTEEEKMAVYERPYIDIVGDIIGKTNAYEDMKAAGVIEFMTTSYVRGISVNDAIIIVDESQNMTLHELNSVMGRVGKNTRICVLGDVSQNDLVKKRGDETGFPCFLKIIEAMREFEKILFQRHDIIRSSFCKSWICAFEDYMASTV
jgi:phosphate starvation-inducible protein PhoH and related proteins